jgi:hypothetical protein
MQSSRYILSIGAVIGSISLVYFLSLIAHLPFVITVALVGVGIFFLVKWFTKQAFIAEERIGNFALAILIAGTVVLTNKVYYIATIHGPWDAWAIWNLNALNTGGICSSIQSSHTRTTHWRYHRALHFSHGCVVGRSMHWYLSLFIFL